MPGNIKIDVALADLEAGKFSFRMVDAIKNHIGKLESELEVTHSLHANAVRELKLQEYSNWRLEREITSLNARTQALLRANMLTENVCRMMKPIAVEIGKYFSASFDCAGAAFEKAMTYLKSDKPRAQLVDSSSKLYAFLKENAPTDETFQEIQYHAKKVAEPFKIFGRHATAQVARATAYLSDLHKTSE
jgi:hypothetical protein